MWLVPVVPVVLGGDGGGVGGEDRFLQRISFVCVRVSHICDVILDRQAAKSQSMNRRSSVAGHQAQATRRAPRRSRSLLGPQIAMCSSRNSAEVIEFGVDLILAGRPYTSGSEQALARSCLAQISSGSRSDLVRITLGPRRARLLRNRGRRQKATGGREPSRDRELLVVVWSPARLS